MMQKEVEMELRYQELLILAYFKSHYKKYEFNEILIIMGMTFAELKDTIDRLIELEYLKIYDDYIVVSKLGEYILEKNRLDSFYSRNIKEERETTKININEPYIPIGFEI